MDSIRPNQKELLNQLTSLLQTLKKNREQVPLKLLKTKYQKGYNKLIYDIKRIARDYSLLVALHDFRVRTEYCEGVCQILQTAIDTSDFPKKLSQALFLHYSADEVTSLALALQQQFQKALEPFIGKHTGLYLTEECLEHPEIPPLFYCFATDCAWLYERGWVPIETYRKEQNICCKAAPEGGL